MLFTYRDAVDHLIRVCGANVSGNAHGSIRMAIQHAAMQLTGMHTWRHFVTHLQIPIQAPYSTGTIAYDHTGGTSERLVTLTSGTFPTWANYGYLRIGQAWYRVDRRLTGTTLTLTEDQNPGADVASGTSYSLAQVGYVLPENFQAIEEVYARTAGTSLTKVTPADWLLSMGMNTTGQPCSFVVMGDRAAPGRIALLLGRVPDAADTLEVTYKRHLSNLRYSGYDETLESVGTAAVTAGSTTVTGTGTAFESDMVGAVFRIGKSSSLLPVEIGSADNFNTTQWVHQSVIVEVTNATTLVLAEAPTQSLSTKKYVVASLIDLTREMWLLFLRLCELQLAHVKDTKRLAELVKLADVAAVEARIADNSTYGRKSLAGSRGFTRLGRTSYTEV